MADERLREIEQELARYGYMVVPQGEVLHHPPKHPVPIWSRHWPAASEFHEVAYREHRDTPAFVTPEGMEVRALSPFGGAVWRALLNGYSVYLDCYDRLGLVGQPYYEVLGPTGDPDRFLAKDVQSMVDLIAAWPKVDPDQEQPEPNWDHSTPEGGEE